MEELNQIRSSEPVFCLGLLKSAAIGLVKMSVPTCSLQHSFISHRCKQRGIVSLHSTKFIKWDETIIVVCDNVYQLNLVLVG